MQKLMDREMDYSKIFKQVLQATELNQLTTKSLYQLESMGLVKWDDNDIVSRYRLYQYYFNKHL